MLASALFAEAAPVNPPATPLPGLQTGEAPWGRGVAFLRERLRMIGLPALEREGTVVHLHQHLDIFVHGRRVLVPADVGIDERQRFIAPIHTHDPSGVLHVESDDPQTFNLGQFFDIWGVRFDRKCLGGSCVEGEQTLRVYVDGRESTGDPRAIPLEHHQEIAIVVARPGDPPIDVPWIYNFPPNL